MQNRIILFLIFSLYLAYHLYTLNINPLPWFDETYYASISFNFSQTGKLVPGVTKSIQEGREMLLHGPVYYLLGAFSFKIFGLGIFQFRIINFLFGVILVFLTARLFRSVYKGSDISVIIFFVAVFLLDPFLNLSLHEGRMDLVAMIFIVVGIFLLLKGLEYQDYTYLIFSGIYCTVAVLTSPRAGFIMIALLLVFLYSAFRLGFLKGLLMSLSWGIPIVIIYGFWIYFAFGGINSLLSYYGEISTGKHSVDTFYFGGSLYIPRHEYLLIGVSVISLVYGLVSGIKYFDKLILICILSIILFYLIVRDLGPYSALILPFYYLIIFKSLHLSGEVTMRNPVAYILVILFAFNSGYFVVKGLQILSERQERDPAVAESFVEQVIPEGSHVIGDPTYYYAVRKSGSEYQYADLFGTLEEREEVLREDFNYDYFIVTERMREKNPEVIDYFFDRSELVRIGTLVSGRNNISLAIARLGFVSDMERHGYGAEIYRRIR